MRARRERTESGSGLRYRVQRVEEVAGRARQAVETRHQENIVLAKLRQGAAELREVAPGSADCLALRAFVGAEVLRVLKPLGVDAAVRALDGGRDVGCQAGSWSWRCSGRASGHFAGTARPDGTELEGSNRYIYPLRDGAIDVTFADGGNAASESRSGLSISADRGTQLNMLRRRQSTDGIEDNPLDSLRARLG